MKKTLITICAMSLFCQTFAQGTLTPETLWKMGRVSLEDISPDGKLVVYGVTQYNLAENKGNTDLFLLDVVGGKVQPLTQTAQSEENARFTPKGDKVGFIREGICIEINLSDRKEHHVLPKEIQPDGFLYSPTGKQLLTIQEVKYRKTPKEIYPDLPLAEARIYDDLMYRHWKSWEDDKNSNVFVYDYAEGVITNEGKNIVNEPFDTPLKPDGGIEEVAWSTKGTAIAYTCKKSDGVEYALSTNSDIYLYDVLSGKTHNLSASNKGYDKEPVFSPTDPQLVWLQMQTPGYEADRARIILGSVSKIGKTEDLTEKFDRTVEHVRWSRDGNTLYFITADGGTKQIYQLDVKSRQIRPLTNGVCDYTAFVVAEGCLIASRQSMSSPSELYKISLKDGSATQVTFINQDILKNVKMGEVKKRMVKASDGKDLMVWMIYPPDFDPNKKYPALLYCQGGPQSYLTQFWSYRWNFQLMAANGYIVIAPIRRGAYGLTQEWTDQIAKDWGGQCMQDYLSAVDNVSRETYIDRDRLGAVGASFGGYSVYWLEGNHQKRFKAFIAHCGMFNTESWYGTTEELFFANHDLGGPYWEKGNRAYSVFSPHTYADKWDTPLLVIHGEKDYRVPLSEGLQAYQAARLKGIPSRLLTFPTEGHWITSPQNSVLWQREFFGWLDKYLK